MCLQYDLLLNFWKIVMMRIEDRSQGCYNKSSTEDSVCTPNVPYYLNTLFYLATAP